MRLFLASAVSTMLPGLAVSVIRALYELHASKISFYVGISSAIGWSKADKAYFYKWSLSLLIAASVISLWAFEL